MRVQPFIAALRDCFALWFHKRNIIIVSEHKVKHIPISGSVQFIALVMLVGSVCWASYSTGRMMAAGSVLKEQSQTLRTLATARVENSLGTLLPNSRLARNLKDNDTADAMPQPMFPLPALDNVRLYARVALLEKKVSDLKATNETIVQGIRDKTSGRIEDLEALIKQTGLSLPNLKREFAREASRKGMEAEGGPYIPVNSYPMPSGTKEMFNTLDELALLRRIMSNLPLAMPIKVADEQSSFGRRIDPFTGRLAFHSGLDLAGPDKAEIHATADGKVVATGRNSSYGEAIDIDHGFGIVTRYGHLSEILVEDGQTVRKGDVIGLQGSTGRSTGDHLHYEVRYYDKPLNPKNFLNAGHYVTQE